MKLLIAEDDVQQAHLLGSLVQFWGYEPQLFHDGEAAYRALQQDDAPRLVVLDWGLPGMDGLEICRALRQDGRRYTYVVMLTGKGGREERIAGLEAGADDFLAKPVDEPELRARLNVGGRIINLQAELLKAQDRLHEQATRDMLTGAWNRRAILERLEVELARSGRENTCVGVLLLDLDHFKRINDDHGHLAGDRVLHQLAQRMQEVLRPYDAVGRYGGEEFLLVLPNCDKHVTQSLAERLRASIADSPVNLDDDALTVTASLGVICWCGPGGESLQLLRRADEALYRAKNAGRNQAVFTDLAEEKLTGTCT